MLTIFLDMETTGLDPNKHRAIDVACKIVDISEGKVRGSYQSIIKQGAEAWARRDPVSMEINGFKWEMIEGGKEASEVSKEIMDLFTSLKILRGKAVFICQNPGFDRAFFSQLVDVYTQERLLWPYHWLDLASMYWTKIVQRTKDREERFPEAINLSKNEIARAYQLPSEQQPHRAMNGVNHLILCYEALFGVKFSAAKEGSEPFVG
jgi:oligoribonuclease